ncbi:hypothetical protein [Aliarcobacter skirrowii]|uniref:Uncharacterized protein n=1 Tax=Aliarcobacter skirrowii TaxID=28200 RepID=A0A2U2C2M5_9BACT|nr:hypothetical protein [Aliarcobacter skirrowii]MDX4063001.1 hypothetical protein [Aliarcobacter skirrowii]PWE22848.1 hypothetical protein DGF29_02005 [Aliarcobacter skirrowii]PWE23276.1 hypothetical protein DF188_00965 [Aliarcobacter skirrowii]PWE25675.1 hypothetical protein DGE88_04260 [Aliarcobacter skirrowii]RJO56503.1 hypothetical protein DIR39_01005 [Aliarcobacter skirrowii]
MNYELLSRVAMQDAQRLKSENVILMKKNLLLEQENNNLKEMNNILDREKDAYKQRARELKKELNDLALQKDLLLKENSKLEDKLEELVAKLEIEKQKPKDNQQNRRKIYIDKDDEPQESDSATRRTNRLKSVEFYS